MEDIVTGFAQDLEEAFVHGGCRDAVGVGDDRLAVLLGGEEVAGIGRLDPVLAFWVPFVLFAALILWMYYRVAFVPGGQAIGALESAFAKLSKRVRKLFARRTPRVHAGADTMQAAPAE